VGQPSKKKLVVLEVSPVAASTGKRRKPEESDEEQQQVQRVQLRPRQRQNQQKQPLRKVVTPKLSQPSLASRPRSESLKQLLPRQPVTQPTASTHPRRQLGSTINPQRPKSRRVRGTQLQQNSELKDYSPQEKYTRQDNQLASSPRLNPWAVNPKSKTEKLKVPASRSPNNKSFSTPSSPGKGGRHENVLGRIRRNLENQNPKSIDVGRGGKGRSQPQLPKFQLFKQLTDSRNRRGENRPSQVGATGPSVKASVGITGVKRIIPAPIPQSSPNQKNRTSRRLQKRPLSLWVYIIRLLILGIGIGAIAGTLLSALGPTTQASVKTNDALNSQVQENPSQSSRSTALPMGQELSPLKVKIQTLVEQYPQLQPGIFIVDLDRGAYLDWSSDSTVPAASTIKLPILIALFQDVEAGKVRLDESLTLKPEMRVGGSGDLQYKKPGTQYILLEVAKKMITISDNTATNMLIERLGGIEALSQRFHSWGLTTTVLRNPLPDVEGTNTTSPKELTNLLLMLNQGQLVSGESRDRMLDIMQQTQTNALLPKGLGVGATIAHKTGTIGSLLGDVGLVNMPTGKRYVICVMVKRPHNDITAEQLIRQISRTAYDYFNQAHATPSTTSFPSGSAPTATKASAERESAHS
jgi:beta-lactamase class A